MAHASNATQRHAAGTRAVFPRSIFLLGFVLFGVIAVVGSLVGAPWRSWLPGAEGVKSVTGGVKAAVYTFMSHLQ